jgi:hypothetical protein
MLFGIKVIIKKIRTSRVETVVLNRKTKRPNSMDYI